MALQRITRRRVERKADKLRTRLLGGFNTRLTAWEPASYGGRLPSCRLSLG
jgi:hypothetical protein